MNGESGPVHLKPDRLSLLGLESIHSRKTPESHILQLVFIRDNMSRIQIYEVISLLDQVLGPVAVVGEGGRLQ